MDRDEKIDDLANHLLLAHDDNVRLREDLKEVVGEVRGSKQETYKVNLILADFTAEARLLINDRINDMSVERLAEVLPRRKVDQVRALLYAREKGIEDVPFDSLPPEDRLRLSSLRREPTGSQPTQEAERKDPWAARLISEGFRANWKTIIALAVFLLAAAVMASAGARLLKALDHSHLLGEEPPRMEHKQ